MRNKEKQDDQRRKEKQAAPVYDYANKFSYPAYLRDEKVPAFIPMKSNNVKETRKEAQAEKVISEESITPSNRRVHHK